MQAPLVVRLFAKFASVLHKLTISGVLKIMSNFNMSVVKGAYVCNVACQFKIPVGQNNTWQTKKRKKGIGGNHLLVLKMSAQ